jgi:K+-sensing histidine kinase KdpD
MLIMTDLTQTMALERLQKDNDMMIQLQAYVTHDMRAPLKAIDVCVELVLRTLSLTREQTKLIEPIRFSSALLGCLVNNLLD